jgi:predicted MPP superfamily phosphohydrolase
MTTPVSPSAVEGAPSSVPPAAESTGRAFTRRRLIRIAIIVPAILLTVNAFVCATLSHFLDISGWLIWQAIPGGLALAFIAATIAGFRYSNLFLRLTYAVSAAWLGALNFAFFAAAACWLISIPDRLAGWPVDRFDLAATIFGLALALAVYGLINAAWIRVTRVDIRLPNLPPAWQGRTLALLTDLHLGHIAGPGFLGRIISRLRALQPDAVLISGDMFDGTTVKLDQLVAPWRNYSAPRGIFYVTGNHDEFAERTIYLDAVERTGVRALNNEKVVVDGLQIVGVHDSEAGDASELRGILRGVSLDPDRPSILLAHRPVNLAVAEEEGISLQLSGHTHQGQIWPWTLLVSRLFGPFAYGLHRLNKLQVYTSSGAGAWGPPLRVGTKSEIVLIRFL